MDLYEEADLASSETDQLYHFLTYLDTEDHLACSSSSQNYVAYSSQLYDEEPCTSQSRFPFNPVDDADEPGEDCFWTRYDTVVAAGEVTRIRNRPRAVPPPVFLPTSEFDQPTQIDTAIYSHADQLCSECGVEFEILDVERDLLRLAETSNRAIAIKLQRMIQQSERALTAFDIVRYHRSDLEGRLKFPPCDKKETELDDAFLL